MAKFKYSAIGADGSTVTGVQEALSATQARMALIGRDLEPVELAEKKSFLSFELTKKKVPRKDLMHFSRQLAVFIRAGIPMIEGLEAIGEETSNKSFQLALAEMSDSLKAGATFADAAALHPHVFPDFYLGILRSAELTGNLDVVLEQLSEYIERDLEARQKVVGALIYPGVIMAVSVITVIVLVSYVLPKFEEFFASLNADLPLPTRILMNIGAFFGTWWWLVIIGLIAFVTAVVMFLKTERGRVLKDRTMLRVPAVGEIVEFSILERFCRILSSMVGAGVPLPEALKVTSDATNNRRYQQGLVEVHEAMLRGEGLAGPLAATGLFPGAARQMFRVGENTGTLDQQLQTAATYFDRELDYKIKRFTSLFEPAVIVGAGLIVGFVAIALVSAMYGILDQAKV